MHSASYCWKPTRDELNACQNVEAVENIKFQTHERDEAADAVLARRFRDGEEAAFSAIVLKYRDRMFRMAVAILGDEQEAMDISQDTFVRAYENFDSFRGDAALFTWLYRICYNLCLTTIRRRKIVSFFSFDREDIPEPVSESDGPEETCEQNEIRDAVQEALKSLPPRQRAVFIMKQMDGLKHEEIAQATGLTTGAVKASYFQAVQKLRKLLSRYGDHDDVQ